MPTRRETVLALGTTVAVAGCSGLLPETEPNLPTSDDIDRRFAAAEVTVRDPELTVQGNIVAIDVAVTIANASSESRRVRVRARVFEEAELINGGSTIVNVPSNRNVTENIGTGKITFANPSDGRALTRLIVGAKVGDFDSAFQPIAVYTGDEVRELAG